MEIVTIKQANILFIKDPLNPNDQESEHDRRNVDPLNWPNNKPDQF